MSPGGRPGGVTYGRCPAPMLSARGFRPDLDADHERSQGLAWDVAGCLTYQTFASYVPHVAAQPCTFPEFLGVHSRDTEHQFTVGDHGAIQARDRARDGDQARDLG